MILDKFFTSVRGSVFGGKLTQGVVDSLTTILDSCSRNKVTSDEEIAYVLATARHESYNVGDNPDWLPVREGWCKTDAGSIAAVTKMFNAGRISKNYALPVNGHSYFGRGFCQITHLGNYQTLGKRIGADLVNYPEKALERRTAADLLVIGSKEGLYTTKKLSDYFGKNDPNASIKARAIINGKDAAERIAGYYDKFLIALRAK